MVKRKIAKFVVAIIIIIIATIVYIFNEPHINKGKYLVAANDNDYGNTSANIMNGGRVCEYGEDVLLATNSGIKLLMLNEMESVEFLDISGKYINSLDGEIYLVNNYDIYLYNEKLELIDKNTKYDFFSMQAIDKMLFTYSDGYIPVFNCTDITENKTYHIRGTSFPGNGQYFDGKLYYIEKNYENYDSYYFCTLDSKGSLNGLFEVLSSIKFFIFDNNVFYSYYNAESNKELLGIWKFDLSNNSNIRLLPSNEDILIENIIDNKIIYQYSNYEKREKWVIYDLETDELFEFIEDDCDVINIYIANEMIFVYLEKDEEFYYRIYDENGNFLNVEIR